MVAAVNFVFQKSDASQKLCWGDIILELDPETNREHCTKTRNDGANEAPRKIFGTAFASRTDRNPIMFYREFSNDVE